MCVQKIYYRFIFLCKQPDIPCDTLQPMQTSQTVYMFMTFVPWYQLLMVQVCRNPPWYITLMEKVWRQWHLTRIRITSCLWEEELLPTECYLNSFFNYLAKCYSEALQRCLADETCDPSKDDDVMEVLSSLKCFRAVSKENLNDIVDQLAHQELIQCPRYVCNSWAPIMSQLKAFTKFKKWKV